MLHKNYNLSQTIGKAKPTRAKNTHWNLSNLIETVINESQYHSQRDTNHLYPR